MGHERCEGIVEWWDRRKGQGFIRPFHSRTPVHVDADALDGIHVLSEGQHVSFDLELGHGRFEARRVRA
jgi:CspA family cold shock protein